MSAGQLRKHERFRSRFLRNQRDLIVYLPPGYADQPWQRFPVLYLQDGQNLFDSATAFAGVAWNIKETADRLIDGGAVRPLIIVGIYHAGKSRINEYTPTKAPKLGGGRAARYGKFLIQEIMPFLQKEYRVLAGPSAAGIGGSSLGGLVSLYLGLKMPDTFGKIAALSPSVWWNQRAILRFAAAARLEQRPQVWMDIGTREGPRIVQDVEQFRDTLLKKGWRVGEDLHYEHIEGGEHNEAAWAKRVGPFLQFLYPAAATKV